MAVNRPRTGLLGAGRRGRAQAETIHGLADRLEFVGVCDVDESAARAVAEQYRVSAYSDVREFFTRAQLDAVVIVTPPESHHLIARLAAEHGVHMLIETPLATTRAMMDVIEDAASRAGVVVEVAENMWRLPAAQANRAAIEAGLVGRILRISTHYESIGQQGAYHQMALMRFYMGAQVEEIRGFSHEFALDAPGAAVVGGDSELWTQAVLSFANGGIGTCTFVSSWLSALRRGHPRFISIEGTAGFIVSGRQGDGSLHRLENGVQVPYPLLVSETDQKVPARYAFGTVPPIEFVNPYAEQPVGYGSAFGPADAVARAGALTSLQRALAGDPPADFYGIRNARLDQELSIAINESARLDGRPIRLPLGEQTEWESRVHETFQSRWGGDPIADMDRVTSRNFTGGSRY